MRWLARRTASRLPTWLLLLGLVAAGLGRASAALWRSPYGPQAVALAVLLGFLAAVGGWRAALAAVVGGLLASVLAVGLVAWLAPGGRVATAWRSTRRRRFYAARWAEAMDGCGLTRAGVEPVLMRVVGGPSVDRLEVHPAPGSLAVDWRDAAPRLASALEVRSVRVRRDGPRDLLLLVRWRAVQPVEGWSPGLDAEVAETVEQERQRREDGVPATPAGAFPRRPR